jgi:hypothetical protein
MIAAPLSARAAIGTHNRLQRIDSAEREYGHVCACAIVPIASARGFDASSPQVSPPIFRRFEKNAPFLARSQTHAARRNAHAGAPV